MIPSCTSGRMATRPHNSCAYAKLMRPHALHIKKAQPLSCIEREISAMKRRGGHGGRTTAALDDADDAGRKMGSSRTEMEVLCSKLMSLVPQDYQLANSQGSSDLPGQLKQAASYIKDLRERVEKLKQRRDDCYAKFLQVTKCSCSDIVDEAAHFDVNFTLSSEKNLELYKVIHAIEQDQCIKIIKASSCVLEDSKIAYTIKCRASSEVVLDAPMVATRLRRLFIE